MPVLSVLVALLLALGTHALDYSYTAPTQCDSMTVMWENGQPPFTLMLNAGYASPIIYQMEDKTWDGKKGTFTIDHLPLKSKTRFLLTMYDKSGITSAVSSEILTVGVPIKNATCDSNPNPAQFTFSVDDALRQCGTYNFYAYSGAGVTLPITVYGIIAGGSVFQRRAGATDERFPVVVDLPTGTNLVYWMTDAQGQSGGLTDMLSVLSSEDNSCITADSPKVTGDGPTVLEPDASELSTGAIAAAVIGTLIAFAAIGAFIFIRKRRSRTDNSGVMPEPFVPGHGRQASRFSRRRASVDLLAANQRGGYHQQAGMPSPLTPARSYADPSFNSSDPSFTPDPFVGEPTPHTVTSFRMQQESEVGGQPSTRRSSTSKGQLRTPGTPRFILHTDAGVVEPREPEEDEVVELPPMYSDTRPKPSGSSQPLPGTSANEKQRAPPPPPIPEDSSRPLSYTSSMSLPRGPRTERTLSFGGGSSVATGYDDPVLQRSVSQYGGSSHPRDRLPSDSSQRPLRAHNPDDDDDHHAAGSSYPQYDFLDDPAYSQDHHSDQDTDVQLAYESSQSGGPQHPLAPSASQRSQTAMRPTPPRQNTATAAHR